LRLLVVIDDLCVTRYQLAMTRILEGKKIINQVFSALSGECSIALSAPVLRLHSLLIAKLIIIMIIVIMMMMMLMMMMMMTMMMTMMMMMMTTTTIMMETSKVHVS
jgi:hypothetical protein